MLSWIKTQGISADGAKYDWGSKSVNSGRVTTFSEYSVVSEDRCLRMDKSLLETVGPALGCALATGYGMTMMEKGALDNKNIGVVGIGGIGMAVLLGLGEHCPKEIIAMDINTNRLNDANAMGATKVINVSEEKAMGKIEEYTNGKKLDYIFDSSGHIKTLDISATNK